MRIIACVKIVPEEQDIQINADRSLNLDRAASKISLYDLNAIETAAELAAAGEHQVVALTVGGERVNNSKAQKDVLSRGADELVLVSDPSLEGALPETTSAVLAATLRTLEYNLVLCGEGSSDLYAQITGALAAERLNIPVVNFATKVTLSGNDVLVQRTLDTEVEEVRVPLPAVVCVSSEINTPRIPSMKAILQAGKKPIKKLTLADVQAAPAQPGSALETVQAPKMQDRLRNIIEGDSDADVAAFAENLRKVLN